VRCGVWQGRFSIKGRRFHEAARYCPVTLPPDAGVLSWEGLTEHNSSKGIAHEFRRRAVDELAAIDVRPPFARELASQCHGPFAHRIDPR
jgi:hypothetical protein